jgi:hypothetical protein
MEDTQLEELEMQLRSMYRQMVRISIRPQWARFCDFQAGRLPGLLARLAENA